MQRSDDTAAESAGNERPVTRRAVVGGIAGAAVLACLGGTAKAFAGEGDFLRPPGGADYASFLGACIRCDRCRSACPQGAIAVCLTSDGFLNARLPKMNYRFGHCDMCDGDYRCIAVCPMGALKPFDAERDKIGLAAIDTKVCLIYTNGTCDARCIGSCKWEALSIGDNGKLALDPDRCNGCGACEEICPANSYGNNTRSGNRGINVEAVV